jgi:hypothetical protein
MDVKLAGIGSPALLMMQGSQLAQRYPLSKEFLTAWALRGADFIKSAGEPKYRVT